MEDIVERRCAFGGALGGFLSLEWKGGIGNGVCR